MKHFQEHQVGEAPEVPRGGLQQQQHHQGGPVRGRHHQEEDSAVQTIKLAVVMMIAFIELVVIYNLVTLNMTTMTVKLLHCSCAPSNSEYRQTRRLRPGSRLLHASPTENMKM